MRTNRLSGLTWPASRLGEAIDLLAQKSGLITTSGEVPAPPDHLRQAMVDHEQAGYEAAGRWIETVATHLGLEAEEVDSAYPEVEALIAGAGPALIRLPENFSNGPEPHFLAVVKSGRWWSTVLTPTGSTRRVKPASLRAVFCSALEQPYLEPINQLLHEAGIAQGRWDKVRTAILREQLNQARVGGCWLLRFSPQASPWLQAQRAKLPRYLLLYMGVYLVYQLLFLFSWYLVGRGALSGQFEIGWLVGWALLLLTLIPLNLWTVWLQSSLAIGAGGLLKKRLLYGALRLQPDEVRHQGAGQFLGRVMDSEAVELLALSGGFAAMVSLIELALAMWVLSQGAGGTLGSFLLLLWVAVTLALGWVYFRRSRDWVQAHLKMTHDLVERMVGHRTRLAQEPPETWHELEDQLLAQYLKQVGRLDTIDTQLNAFIPQGWLVVGLMAVAYAILAGQTAPAALAITLGGILLGGQALGSLVAGLGSVVGAMLSWQQVSVLYEAADRPVTGDALSAVMLARKTGARQPAAGPLLTTHDLTYRYQPHSRPALQACNLEIYPGDQLLLEGPSGGGKSTLASVLVGLREPESGLLLLHGLDRHSLGAEAWRRRVVAAPQFHENYVLTGTFAFNLLLGRVWPAPSEDLAEAETICRELGLGEVLDRMPAGLQQMVGEGGWQLSHGERSRLYIARALLQQADLIVLDESFASLDPGNLRRALESVLQRAPTVLVIAHP